MLVKYSSIGFYIVGLGAPLLPSVSIHAAEILAAFFESTNPDVQAFCI
jgi:hypothetical protein